MQQQQPLSAQHSTTSTLTHSCNTNGNYVQSTLPRQPSHTPATTTATKCTALYHVHPRTLLQQLGVHYSMHFYHLQPDPAVGKENFRTLVRVSPVSSMLETYLPYLGAGASCESSFPKVCHTLVQVSHVSAIGQKYVRDNCHTVV
jgi:hypothetical protein